MEQKYKKINKFIYFWNICFIMDQKSERILEALKENSKLSSREISRKTKIPLTTVHHRIKKLEQEGIIENYSVKINNKKIGLDLCAYIMASVSPAIKKEAAWHKMTGKILKSDFVESADVITGEKDLIIKVRAKNVEHLNTVVGHHLRSIEGIEDTVTMVVLEEGKKT